MGIQQGLCSIGSSYLLAAWKNDPQHPAAGDHFGRGVEDQITYASLDYQTPEDWTIIGTMPANTSIGPALVYQSRFPAASVYAVWKGEGMDNGLYFGRLTLPPDSEGQIPASGSQSWKCGQIPGAKSSSSPSIAYWTGLYSELGLGFGSPPFLFTLWTGLNSSTLWYSVTPIPQEGYVSTLAAT